MSAQELTFRERELLRRFGPGPQRSISELALIDYYRHWGEDVHKQTYVPSLDFPHGPDFIYEIDRARRKLAALAAVTTSVGAVPEGGAASAAGPNVVSIKCDPKSAPPLHDTRPRRRQSVKATAAKAAMLADLKP